MLGGIATDETVAAIELRATVIGNTDIHRIAGTIEFDTGRLAPTLDTCFALAAMVGIIAAPAAAFLRGAFAIAANFTLAALIIPAALHTIAVVAATRRAIVVIAALAADSATTMRLVFATIARIATERADTASGLVVVAAAQPRAVTATSIQVIGGGQQFTPIALNTATTVALVSAIQALAANFAFLALILAMTLVALFAVAAFFAATAMSAVPAIEQIRGRKRLIQRATLLAGIADGFAPAVVTLFARPTLVVVTTLHTGATRIISGRDGEPALVGRADWRGPIRLIEACQAISAIAREAGPPLSTIAVIAAVSARHIALVVSAAFLSKVMTEFAVDDRMAIGILIAAFGAIKRPIMVAHATFESCICADGVTVAKLVARLTGRTFGIGATCALRNTVHATTAPTVVTTDRIARNLSQFGNAYDLLRRHRFDWIDRRTVILCRLSLRLVHLRCIGGRWIRGWWIRGW